MQSSAAHSTVKGEEAVCYGERILSVDSKTRSPSDLLVECVDRRVFFFVYFIQIQKKSEPAFLPLSASRLQSHLLISPPPRGERRNKACQALPTPVFAATTLRPQENTLLIGFRYLQNDLFNGITTRIMILFMRRSNPSFGAG